MNESSVKHIQGKMVPVPGNDIDTDRIIPARFMKVVTFEGLGQYAFNDERYDRDGKPKDHPFNDPRYAGHSILIAQKNFGCGSSREHAPQSLIRWGIRALIGESFADIFAGNCSANGVPAVTMSEQDVAALLSLAQKEPETEIRIDLESMTVSAGDRTMKCSMPDSSRKALLTGTWDLTTLLLQSVDKIKETAQKIPYINNFA